MTNASMGESNDPYAAHMSELVSDIRSYWSHKGVEIESESTSKIKCRMPPVFQNVQDFCDSLAHHGVEIDMETSCSDNHACVVFIVYDGNPHAPEDSYPPRSRPKSKQPVSSLTKLHWFMLIVSVLQAMIFVKMNSAYIYSLFSFQNKQ